MLGNKTEYPNNHANALTNNTFSLVKTEKHLKRAMYNSFNYLRELQDSYISIHRFNLTEQNLYTDYNNKICLTIDKDFIDYPLRKAYRSSAYYNKYVDIDVLSAHPEIFAYIPIVIIDGKTIFSYVVKSALDGTTTIQFPDIVHNKKTYVNTPHDIEVVFMKDLYMHSFVTNVFQLEDHNWKLPPSITGLSLQENQIVFLILKDPNKREASNMYLGSVAQDGYLRIDGSNQTIYDFIIETNEFEVTVLSPAHIYSTGGAKQIKRRSIVNKKSASVIISPSVDNTYTMPVPPENLFILKVNKLTGESTYENKRAVSLHYPNIYEIDSDDVDPSVYEYQVFYVYREIMNYLKYPNKFKFIHNYIAKKLNTTFEDAVDKLLYTLIDDYKLQQYFLSIYDYQDPTFSYTIDNYKKTDAPYDFDYKINDMKRFIAEDPWILKDYAEDVAVPYTLFYLYVNTIDLESRVRMSTRNEAINPSDIIDFTEPHYVFAFKNETSTLLNMRFFVDGVFMNTPVQINSGFLDYFYIPVSKINSDSYIEIENHYDYIFRKNIRFDNADTPVVVDFTQNPFVLPTLNDLYITNENGVKLNRDLFRMYIMVDIGDFDISDYINKQNVDSIGIRLFEDIYVDEYGDCYIQLEDPYEPLEDSLPLHGKITFSDREAVDSSETRLPLKYTILTKLKIFCSDPTIISKACVLNINKTSHLYTTKIENKETIRLQIVGYDTCHTNKKSFIRTFINGKFIPSQFNYHPNGGKEYIVPNYYLNKNDVISIDVTPFSYDKVYELETIPSDFLLNLEGHIPAPFDTKYYDIYLNGKKLSDNNIEVLSPVKIKLFNVHSVNNLYIFKRDRDYEFYGFELYHKTPLDEFLESELIPDEYKNEIIDMIVNSTHGEVTPGDNTEPKFEEDLAMDKASLDLLNFYFEVIVPEYTARPNTLFFDSDEIDEKYHTVYERYANGDRLVLKPNINYDAPYLLMIGKLYDGAKIV